MIDMENQVITMKDKHEVITSWQVWFRTPFGLCDSLELAIKGTKDMDLSPNLCIVPVAVAVTATTYEAWER